MNAIITVEQVRWAHAEAMSIPELYTRLMDERGYSMTDALALAWQCDFANMLLAEGRSIGDYRSSLIETGIASQAADHLAEQMLHLLSELRIVSDDWRRGLLT